MPDPVFVLPAKPYDSYMDFTRLIGLAGFKMITQEQARLDDPDAVYIFVGPEGIPDCRGAIARCIFWQLEYAGDYADQPNWRTCRELWGSDPGWCDRNFDYNIKYILLGSDERLSFTAEKRVLEYDLVALAYLTPRRQAIRDALSGYRWPQPYPGHNTTVRHNILLSSAFMLHVHQHEGTPYCLAPIRLALAAAYHLPVVCEDVAARGPYDGAVYAWSAYEGIVGDVRGILAQPVEVGNYQDGLHDLLCKEWPFRRCVLEALK